MNEMTDNELKKISIEEFSRLQDYMIDVDKSSKSYEKMKRRYIELKAILNSMGVNIVELDTIQE